VHGSSALALVPPPDVPPPEPARKPPETESPPERGSCAAERWPQAAGYMRDFFPVDDGFVTELAAIALKELPGCTDRELFLALRKARYPRQESAGLWKTTVARVLRQERKRREDYDARRAIAETQS
jgi:hypothetical protein